MTMIQIPLWIIILTSIIIISFFSWLMRLILKRSELFYNAQNDKNDLLENIYNRIELLLNDLKTIDDRNLGAYSKSEDLYKFFTILDSSLRDIEDMFIIEKESELESEIETQ